MCSCMNNICDILLFQLLKSVEDNNLVHIKIIKVLLIGRPITDASLFCNIPPFNK